MTAEPKEKEKEKEKERAAMMLMPDNLNNIPKDLIEQLQRGSQRPGTASAARKGIWPETANQSQR